MKPLKNGTRPKKKDRERARFDQYQRAQDRLIKRILVSRIASDNRQLIEARDRWMEQRIRFWEHFGNVQL